MPVPSSDPQELNWPERLARLGVWALVIGVFARNLGPLKEGDEWMHLSIGRWMLAHGTLLPTPDPLIWNDRGGDMQHEWLSQVVLAGVMNVLGFAGLRLVRGALIALTAYLVVHIVQKATQRWSAALVATAIWWLVTQPHAAARPHVLGWIFALVTLGIVLAEAAPWTRRRWFAFAALLIVWAQAHSSQIIAPAFIGLHTLGLTWTRWRSGQSPWDRPWIARTAIAGIAVFLQPCGWRLIPYALRSPRVAEGLVEEWAPTWAPDVWRIQPWVPVTLAVLLVTVIAVAFIRRKSLSPAFPNALPALLASVESLHTRRMTFFTWLPLLFVFREARIALPAAVRTLLAFIVAASVWWTIGRVPQVWPENDWVQKNFPVAATPFLVESDLHGRLFNPDPWGGWLAWWLNGRQMPSTDGRMLMAGRQWALDSQAIQVHAPSAEQLLAQNNIAVLTQRQADWLQVRPLDPQQFALAWADNTAVVILRRGKDFDHNVHQTCAFYGKNPQLARYGVWPVRLQGPPGQPSPTDVPSVLTMCNK